MTERFEKKLFSRFRRKRWCSCPMVVIMDLLIENMGTQKGSFSRRRLDEV